MTGQSEREGTTGALRIGIDLGGTKTEVAVLDPAGGFLLRRRAATPRNDYRATVATIAQLVTDAETSVGANCTVGVGIPGAISPATGLVKNANSSWLNGQPLLEDLQAALSRSVRIQNDANCLAMSEAADGAACRRTCRAGCHPGHRRGRRNLHRRASTDGAECHCR
jgi:fructokinase